jgi:MFS superfamily sulfate permease-like transporter
VLIGFLSGVGIQVSIAVLGQLLGIPSIGYNPVLQLWTILSQLSTAHVPTILVSAVVLIFIASLRWFKPRIPASLIAVILTISASYYFDFNKLGIVLIGPVAGGLPSFALPHISWGDVQALLPISAACFMMIITQSSATARAFDAKHNLESDENRDLLGLGTANIIAGFSGTFVVNGSPTQTAMLESCGGRSQLANVATDLTVGAVLLLLTGPLQYLPLCVLGVIVLLVAIRMIDINGFRELWICRGKEFYVALFTAVSVVLFGVEYGISLALIVSLLDHVRRGYHPRTAVIVRDPNIHWRMEQAAPNLFVEPGVILYWFGTDLYYANTPHFCSEIRMLVEKSPGTKALIVDCGAVTSIDFTAGEEMSRLSKELASQGVTLLLARVTEGLRHDLERHGVFREIGEKNIFRSRKAAVSSFEVNSQPKENRPYA